MSPKQRSRQNAYSGRHVLISIMLLSVIVVGVGRAVERPWPSHVVDDSSRGADGVKLADINGDGLLDIATGWEEGGLTRAYLHPGPAKATERWPAVTVGRTPAVEDAVWVDLDADGARDIVTCCEGRTRTVFVHWAPKRPSDLLSEAAWQQEAIPVTEHRMQWMFAQPIEIDGANGVDLVLAGKGQDAQLGWLQSPPKPRDLDSWKWHPISDVGWVMSIFALDMDSDGDTDILTTDRRGDARGCRWLENPGSGAAQTQRWTSHAVGGQGREVMFAALADLDRDGLQDVLVPVKDAEVLLLRRLDAGGKRWAESVVAFPENMGRAKGIAAGDLDADGQTDIVISCEGATPPKSGLKWLSYRDSPFGSNWQGHEIGGPAGIKFDRIELFDLDADGDLDVLTCEERHDGRGLGVIWYENPIGPPRRE